MLLNPPVVVPKTIEEFSREVSKNEELWVARLEAAVEQKVNAMLLFKS